MGIKALVVLSGGQDSTTCLAMAVKQFGANQVRAITFYYGQRHAIEIQAAQDVAWLAGVAPPEILSLPAGTLQGTSPLTNKSEDLELYENYEQMDAVIGDRVEKTFVPMRNALFLTIAANRAVVMGAEQVWTGVCQADNANYPDCRWDFINAQEITISKALGGVNAPQLITPLMFTSKAMSIKRLAELGPKSFALLGHSHTAYDGQYPPVGKDHASVLRAQGFLEVRWPDPLVIRANAEGLMELPDTINYSDAAVNAAIRANVMDNERQLQTLAPHRLSSDQPLEQGDH